MWKRAIEITEYQAESSLAESINTPALRKEKFMRKIAQIVALITVLTTSSVACFGISQEEFQLALDEQASTAQQQADASSHQHIQAIAGKDSEIGAANATIGELQESLVVANVKVASLQDQLKTANQETNVTADQLGAERAEVASLKDQLDTGRKENASLQARLNAANKESTTTEAQLIAERSKNAELRDQLDAASKETSTAEEQLNAERAEIETLKSQLSAANKETNTAKAQLDAERTNTENARKETRWVWVPSPFDNLPVLYGLSSNLSQGSTGMLAIASWCTDTNNYLLVWDQATYEDGEDYVIKAGFDDDRLRTETLWGYGDAVTIFAEIEAGELWRAKTFTIDGQYGTAIYDTAQLLRMFPTEKAFCDGEKPKGN